RRPTRRCHRASGHPGHAVIAGSNRCTFQILHRCTVNRCTVKGERMRGLSKRFAIIATAGAATLVAPLSHLPSVVAHAAVTGCRVDYSVTAQWPGGFTADVNITNLGDPINGWTLTWSYAAGQTVTQAWNATITQSGAQVTAKDAG